jgi:hypothetical protein
MTVSRKLAPGTRRNKDMETITAAAAAVLTAAGFVIERTRAHGLEFQYGNSDDVLVPLHALITELHISCGEVIVRGPADRRVMYRIRRGIIENAEELEPFRHTHSHLLQPREPRHGYYGIAPCGKGKWRAVLNTTDPQTGHKQVIVGRYVADPVQAAMDHDRLAREYASQGKVGRRVHLNFAPIR